MNSFNYFFVGPNGSGKTNEFKKFLINSHTPFKDIFPRWNNSEFSFINQSTFNIYPSTNVESCLLVSQVISGVSLTTAKSNVKTLLNRYNFLNILSKKVTQLSGGEYKLLNILIGLLTNKSNLYIDDPFGMLDILRINILIDQINDFTINENINNLILNLPDSNRELITRFNRKNHIINTLNINKDYDLILSCLVRIFNNNCRSINQGGNIVIENLSFEEKIIRHKTIKNLYFEFCPDKMYLIKGENGKGKSLLLSAINGTLPENIKIKSGAILYKGDKIKNRKRIIDILYGKPLIQENDFLLIPQNCHYLFQTDNPLKLFINKFAQNIEEEDINFLYREGLMWDRPTIQASLGEIRFFTILVALLSFIKNSRYKWLLLDEPDSYLDINNKTILLLLLKQISKLGKGIIIISHDHLLFKDLSVLEI